MLCTCCGLEHLLALHSSLFHFLLFPPYTHTTLQHVHSDYLSDEPLDDFSVTTGSAFIWEIQKYVHFLFFFIGHNAGKGLFCTSEKGI
jgi:hypothetical protein